MIDDRFDTIVARATPLGEGAVAIVRLSGSAAFSIANSFVRSDRFCSLGLIPARYLANVEVVNGDEILDHALLTRFDAPRSVTGEDVVELHLHGNMLIVDRVIELAVERGARIAEAGEFTRRAFLNGKIDLTQAEALSDVIRAESEQSLYVAQRQLHGELGTRIQGFRSRIISLLAMLELELDFVEEGYHFTSVEELDHLISELRSFASQLLASYRSGVRLRRGPRVLLLGRPNAGKSSLFNAVVGYSRALVSPIAGTTRDYLEEKVQYRGLVLHILDTAGLHETGDLIEAEGVRRSRQLVAECDHVLYLVDSTDPDAVEHGGEENRQTAKIMAFFRHFIMLDNCG